MGTVWLLFSRRRKATQRGSVAHPLSHSQLATWQELVAHPSTPSFSLLDNDGERAGCLCGNPRRLPGGGCTKAGLRMLDFRVWREGEEGAVVEAEPGSQGRARSPSLVKLTQSLAFLLGHRTSFMLDLCLKTLIFLLQLVDPVFHCIKTAFCNPRCGGFSFLALCAQRLPALLTSPSEWLPGVCGWLEEPGGGEFLRRFFLFSWSKGTFLSSTSSSAMTGPAGAALTPL